MKKILCAVALLLLTSVGQAQTLTAAQAKAHEGQAATVCGTVASEHTAMRSRGEPTFINLDAAYPAEIFTILIWGDDRRDVGVFPSMGSRICATGLIRDYRGVPEMVVRSKKQFSR
jgi:hypothetical protein